MKEKDQILLPMLPDLAPVEENADSIMCSTCKGGCCKNYAGIFAPDQIQKDAAVIAQMIKGNYCLDTWHGDPRQGERPIPKTHPKWFDYEKETRTAGLYIPNNMNEKFNTEKFWEIDILPEIPVQSETYYIRPRHFNKEFTGQRLSDGKPEINLIPVNKLVDRSWGGQCVLLTEAGCSLKFEERPRMCQVLKPNFNFEVMKSDCDVEPGYSKREFMLAWLPYQEVIQQALTLIENEQSK